MDVPVPVDCGPGGPVAGETRRQGSRPSFEVPTWDDTDETPTRGEGGVPRVTLRPHRSDWNFPSRYNRFEDRSSGARA